MHRLACNTDQAKCVGEHEQGSIGRVQGSVAFHVLSCAGFSQVLHEGFCRANVGHADEAPGLRILQPSEGAKVRGPPGYISAPL